MNGRKAKKIRKQVYGNADFKDYYAERKHTNKVTKKFRVSGPTSFSSKIITRTMILADAKRQAYQKAKKAK